MGSGLSLAESFEESLVGLTIESRDRATVELARTYARFIDGGGDLDKFGPLLLKALEALAMTPRSRLQPSKGGATSDERPSPLDELQARRDTRAQRAAALDAASS